MRNCLLPADVRVQTREATPHRAAHQPETSEVGNAPFGPTGAAPSETDCRPPTYRPARCFALPFWVLAVPRARAAFPFAFFDERPVSRPTSSNTRPPRRSSRPSALSRLELLNIIPPPLCRSTSRTESEQPADCYQGAPSSRRLCPPAVVGFVGNESRHVVLQ